MATVNIGNQTQTYIANQANTDYVLEEGATIETSARHGIFGTSKAVDSNYQVDGTIKAVIDGIFVGNNGTANITIGMTGKIEAGDDGIDSAGSDRTIVNDGTITAKNGTGIAHSGENGHISNSGLIDAHWGVSLDGASVITNTGDIGGSQYGIWSSAATGMTRIVNNGSIVGLEEAIHGEAGANVVINKGTINGIIDLGDGNDVYRSTGGHLDGFIQGGNGDDRYFIDEAHTKIFEDVGNGGYDQVRSSVSFKLMDGIEEVTLTGQKNINLTGNSVDSKLTGNAGDNNIAGNLGDDRITGGRGDDTLTGDNGVVDAGGHDTFIFKNHSGADVVTDFHNGEDVFDLKGYEGLNSFSDLNGHIDQVGEDVVVTLLDGDHFTLSDTLKSDLDASDFILG